MKKLIINEKNLPKISKMTDSNIRIRINKTQNSHETLGAKKSLSTQLQEIDQSIQNLQYYAYKNGTLQEEKVQLLVQILKNFKEILNPNQQLMTQSLKFSKLKFKAIVQSQQKQNIIVQKIQKELLEISASDRTNKLIEKSTSKIMKTPKMRKYVSMHKKSSSEQKQNLNQLEKNLIENLQSMREQDDLVQSYELKSLQRKLVEKVELTQPNQYQCTITNNQMPLQNQQNKIQKLTTKNSQISMEIQQKCEQIKELHERIEQLNINIENLVKKNSQKTQDIQKLEQENWTLKKKCQDIEDQFLKVKRNFQNISKQKQQYRNEKQLIEQQKNQKIDQELGRYQTAQRFYQLTRKDLRQQNQQLMSLLHERQAELTNLYQLLKTLERHSIEKSPDDDEDLCGEQCQNFDKFRQINEVDRFSDKNYSASLLVTA